MSLLNVHVCDISGLQAEELGQVTLNEIDEYFKANKAEYLGIVYCYTSNKTGKKYIGQTRQPKSRHTTHRSSSYEYSERSDANSLFSRTVREEGFDNFRYNVLKVCHACDLEGLQSELNVYERYYISLFQTTDRTKGYNKESGGIGEPKGGTSYWAKSVKQYSAEGQFIQEYACINDAVRATGINSSCISVACSPCSERKSAGGFLWTYSNTDLDPTYLSHATRGIIHRYTVEGKYIDTFSCIKNAAIFVNGDRARIHLCASKPPYINVAYGFRWSKEKVELLELPAAELFVEVHKYDKNGIYIDSYPSIRKGAQSINSKSSTHLSICLDDIWRKAGGFYWRTFKTDRIDIPNKKEILYGR